MFTISRFVTSRFEYISKWERGLFGGFPYRNKSSTHDLCKTLTWWKSESLFNCQSRDYYHFHSYLYQLIDRILHKNVQKTNAKLYIFVAQTHHCILKKKKIVGCWYSTKSTYDPPLPPKKIFFECCFYLRLQNQLLRVSHHWDIFSGKRFWEHKQEEVTR